MTSIVVLGDSLLDRDWTGSVSRLCADSTGPVVGLRDETARPGGGRHHGLPRGPQLCRAGFRSERGLAVHCQGRTRPRRRYTGPAMEFPEHPSDVLAVRHLVHDAYDERPLVAVHPGALTWSVHELRLLHRVVDHAVGYRSSGSGVLATTGNHPTRRSTDERSDDHSQA